ARTATAALRALADTEELRVRADALGHEIAESDRIFRAEVVPALDREDRSAALELGRRIAAPIDRASAIAGQLDRDLQARSEAAHAEADKLRAQLQILAPSCFALALGLAVLIGAYLVRSISRPVEAIRRGAQRVGAGDLTVRIGLV